MSNQSTSFKQRNQQLIYRPMLPLHFAQIALQASINHAKSINIPMNISIFSDSLNLLAFARMDDARLTSVDIAHNKAFTAAGHRLDTGAYGSRVSTSCTSTFLIELDMSRGFTSLNGWGVIVLMSELLGTSWRNAGGDTA